MTQIIVQALEMTGQRGIINKGWGGLGNRKSVVSLCLVVSLLGECSFQNHKILENPGTNLSC